MRQDGRREADRNAVRAQHQQERNLRGQINGLLAASVVVGNVGRGLLVEDLLAGKVREPTLDVTRRRVRHARVERAVVPLAVDEIALALAPELVGQDAQRVANGGVAVRVVLHRMTDDVRHLRVAAIVLLPQRMQDATLDGLQAVLDRRNRARADDVRGILAEVEVIEVSERTRAGQALGVGRSGFALLLTRRGRRVYGLRLRGLIRVSRFRRKHVEVVEQARRLRFVTLCH